MANVIVICQLLFQLWKLWVKYKGDSFLEEVELVFRNLNEAKNEDDYRRSVNQLSDLWMRK